jgi:hypothetical protein
MEMLCALVIFFNFKNNGKARIKNRKLTVEVVELSVARNKDLTSCYVLDRDGESRISLCYDKRQPN